MKYDGTVVPWGANDVQTTVPAGLTDAVAISAKDDRNLALKRNVTIGAGVNQPRRVGDDSGQGTSESSSRFC